MSNRVAHDYESLIEALVERKRELRLSTLEVDDIAGLPTGYFSKICCGVRGLGVRSLGLVLQALQVEIIVQPNNNLARGEDQLSAAEKAARNRPPKTNFLKLRSAAGARRKWLLMTEAERRRHIKKMCKARSDAAKARRARQNPLP